METVEADVEPAATEKEPCIGDPDVDKHAVFGAGPSGKSDSTQSKESEKTQPSWDHSNRKVIVLNMLKFMNAKDVDKATKSWLDALDDPNSIRISKTRKAQNMPWVQVTLEHEDMVQPFLNHMNTRKFDNGRGSQLRAQRSEGGDRQARGEDHRRKRTRDNNDGDHSQQKQQAKRHKPLDSPKTDDQIRDAITPLWRQSYDEQLQTKQKDMIRKCALKIVKEVKSRFRNIEKEARRNKNRQVVPVYEWMKKQKPIDVAPILSSPHITEYRNKCEMNFGYRYEVDQETDEDVSHTAGEEDGPGVKMIPSVGFMASGWAGGVSRPHILSNVPSEACAIVDVVNEFLKDSPTLPYDSKTHRGLWRVLTIRISRRTNECMVIIMHAPPSGGLGAKDETDDYSGVFESERERLVSMLTGSELVVPERDYMADSSSKESLAKSGGHQDGNKSPTRFRITSLYFQEYEGVSNPSPEYPVQHAFGERALKEQLGKSTFQISPGAFFQVNTEGAETLYSQVVAKVREVCPKPEETLLFDVCCGTGTIGLTLIKEGVVGRVVGVDISEPAIEDAKVNAELNGYRSSDGETERTHFVAARAEKVLGKEMRENDASSSVVAVVDPAREGLHSDVLRSLRVNRKINRMVYVSCNPTGSLVRDAGVLCAPPTKKFSGRPFYPSSAQPVDMFPLTTHCEMVVTFDRLPEEATEATAIANES